MNDQEFNIYLAGFFDGEGCISSFGKGNSSRGLKVSMAQKWVPILQRIQTHYKGIGTITPHMGSNWVLQFTRPNDIITFLTPLTPFLIMRKEEALLAIEIAKRIGIRGTRYTMEEVVFRSKLEEMLDQAKARRSAVCEKLQ